jgi:hypothetical protein
VEMLKTLTQIGGLSDEIQSSSIVWHTFDIHDLCKSAHFISSGDCLLLCWYICY